MAVVIVPRFDFAAPRSVAEACALLGERAGEAELLAGGTDLLVKIRRGTCRPALVVSLGRVPGLDGIGTTAGGDLQVGALATMSRLGASPVVAGPYAALAEGAGAVGGPLVRNRATIGGNIINARPCADTVPPLIALGARLHLVGPHGQRAVDVDGFITGPGTTGIRRDEVLCAIEVPRPDAPAGSAYLKVTRRAAMEVTVVGCAAAVTLDPTRATVVSARVVLASVAPVPLRVRAAEAVLEGQRPSAAALWAAGAAAGAAVRPISDHRAPAAYRRAVVQVLARRALAAAVARAGGTLA